MKREKRHAATYAVTGTQVMPKYVTTTTHAEAPNGWEFLEVQVEHITPVDVHPGPRGEMMVPVEKLTAQQIKGESKENQKDKQ